MFSLAGGEDKGLYFVPMELGRLIKGNSQRLDGRLLAFAHVANSSTSAEHLQGMVHNGYLAVQGNYRDQRTLAEFFQSEFGLSLEKGIEEVIDQSREGNGLESALDPDLVRERLRSMKDAASSMPIPAKIVAVESHEGATTFEGDVADLGHFDDLVFAHMAVNAFPILYQAVYRQQELLELQARIESLLDASQAPRALSTFEGDVEAHLLHSLLPDILYATEGSAQAHAAMVAFEDFLRPHLNEADLEAMLALVPVVRQGDVASRRKLDLLLKRVAALHREDYKTLDILRHELDALD